MTTTPERSATLTDIVARNIRSRMGWLGIRQRELARRLGENDQWVSVRVKGQVSLNLNDIQRFAKALETELHNLLPSQAEAAAAPVPRTTHGYATVADRPSARSRRPRDNRPPGALVAVGSGRTAFVDRSERRRRDR